LEVSRSTEAHFTIVDVARMARLPRWESTRWVVVVERIADHRRFEGYGETFELAIDDAADSAAVEV
jgi:hypothetical protein